MAYHTSPEAEYDHLDRVGTGNAIENRDASGLETDGANEDFTPEAIAARTGDIALAGFLTDDQESVFTEEPEPSAAMIARKEWVEASHLTNPSHDGPLTFKTPEQRAHHSDQKQRLVGMVSKLDDRPDVIEPQEA